MKIKYILLMISLVLLLGLVGCSAPPSDIPTANSVSTDDTNSVTAEVEPDNNLNSADDNIQGDKPVLSDSTGDSIKTENSIISDSNDSVTGLNLVGDDVLVKDIDITKSSFEFEGYGVGKSHIGTFNIIEGVLYILDGNIIGSKGTIDASSVNTGIGGLDKHLKSEDFFNVNMYPSISLTSKDIVDGIMTAELHFHGLKKDISFPVTVTDNSVSSQFLFDMSLFGIEYTGVNKDVRIAFNFVIN